MNFTALDCTVFCIKMQFLWADYCNNKHCTFWLYVQERTMVKMVSFIKHSTHGRTMMNIKWC